MPKEAKPSLSSSLQLRGTVRAFNVSPKGQIEGVLLETAAGPAQVNFPHHDAATLARSMAVGSQVEVEVAREPEEGHHASHHPVYRSADAPAAAVSGTIVGLNHALHGEVNGYRLDDGTFLHVKPKGARRLHLRVGEKVKAAGVRRHGPDAVVLEVHAVERL